MIRHENIQRILVLVAFVVFAAGTRAMPLFIPHIWNFTAVGALAVFAGAQFKDKRLALIVPLVAMALSDLFLGNGFNMVVYAGFIAMVICGMVIAKNISVFNVGCASIAGAVIFFLITNLAVVYSDYSLYPHNINGIIQSYIMGLPFLRNMIIGDAIYGIILFGGFYLLEKRYPKLSLNYSKS
ncbi:hypothetical protein FW774_07060 [Pedobacter sp. BS3]|uniref:DUF6580 family putative transport protein n=1 Tax=Pedobacter sp. BS3 TaxID=2567937 RepID=UPI0011F0713B|nr:DUF6580 family putative transport protein [Pedobacter sp. BS3]TZF84734.1 hypothetical protein FW774_07060 [Pedobacter sp. BS3]